jgi:hypothetical protein
MDKKVLKKGGPQTLIHNSPLHNDSTFSIKGVLMSFIKKSLLYVTFLATVFYSHQAIGAAPAPVKEIAGSCDEITFTTPSGHKITCPVKGNFLKEDGKWFYEDYDDGRHRSRLIRNLELIKKLDTLDANGKSVDILGDAFETFFGTEGATEAFQELFEEREAACESDSSSESETSDEAGDDSEKITAEEILALVPEGTPIVAGSIIELTKNDRCEKISFRQKVWGWFSWAKSKVYEKRVVIVAGGALVLTIVGGICIWYFYPNFDISQQVDTARACLSGISWVGLKESICSITGGILAKIWPAVQEDTCPVPPPYHEVNNTCVLD